MRLALLLGLAVLFGVLVATIVWLFAFGDVAVRPVSDAPGAAFESAPSPADTPLPELAPLQRPASTGRLLIPVAGVTPADLTDTYSRARAGGARSHDAIDIMAPAGTPVIAAAPGTVEKLFYSERGGITAYLRSTDQRRIYYYAHLDRYAPGLVEGTELAAGDAIGLVGATGNADSEAPHLHFAVMRMREGEGWSEGEAINPYPLLVGPE
ncbi:MAG: M23 family metallopeptidase [Sphingomonadales bacterium]|nr:M23 family metallopeptidase [Sphingomonadales bacterium]